MVNGTPPPKKQTPQEMFESLSWRLNNLDTKLRITEQNVVNMRNHSQLINQNFLDLKKEVRDSVSNVQTKNHDLERELKQVQDKLTELESEINKIKSTPVHKKLKLPIYEDKEQEEKKSADDVLDEILEGKY